MKNVINKVIGLLFFVSVSVNAEQSVENLSDEVRGLLQKEMIAIDAAMKRIVSANAAGDTQQVALIANQIKNSFILKSNLTQHQKHELHTKLPKDFLDKDSDFHYLAGMLAHVAENKKLELIPFYYSKLFEACSGCHQKHATHKFPKFLVEDDKKSHEH